MNHIPEPIKDKASRGFKTFKDKAMGLYKRFKGKEGEKQNEEEELGHIGVTGLMEEVEWM